jgi:hypothetical protein
MKSLKVFVGFPFFSLVTIEEQHSFNLQNYHLSLTSGVLSNSNQLSFPCNTKGNKLEFGTHKNKSIIIQVKRKVNVSFFPKLYLMGNLQ